MSGGLVDLPADSGSGGGTTAATSSGVSEQLREKLAGTEAPRIVIDTESHTVVLTAFDLLMISTVAVLASSTIVATAEVFG